MTKIKIEENSFDSSDYEEKTYSGSPTDSNRKWIKLSELLKKPEPVNYLKDDIPF